MDNVLADQQIVEEIFVRLRQAFDRVWHDGLYFKLLSISDYSVDDTAIDNNTLVAFKELYRNVN